MQPFALCDLNKKWDSALWPKFSCLSQGWIYRDVLSYSHLRYSLTEIGHEGKLSRNDSSPITDGKIWFILSICAWVCGQTERNSNAKNPKTIKIAFGSSCKRRCHSLWRKIKRRELCVEIKQGIHSYANISRVRISQKNPAILNGNGSDQRQLHSHA